MATRSLTEVFILMRNNAIRSRHIYSEQGNGFEVRFSRNGKFVTFRVFVRFESESNYG